MAYHHVAIFTTIAEIESRHPGLQLKRVCSELQIHRHTASAAVIEATGKTFKQWRRDRQMQRAARILLEQPTATVGQVADAAGFSTAQSFARAFTHCYGVTPSAFRQQNGPPVTLLAK